jgi:rare lipoprotein A
MKKLICSIVSFTALCLSNPIQAKMAESGIASIYSVRTNNGTVTASGIPLSDYSLTAAHKTLPLGSFVKVICQKTKKSVVVKITDRGPYVKGRVIDLTPKAAKAIGLDWHKGLAKVSIVKVNSNDLKVKKNIKTRAIKVAPSKGAPFINSSIIAKQNDLLYWTNTDTAFALCVIVASIYVFLARNE